MTQTYDSYVRTTSDGGRLISASCTAIDGRDPTTCRLELKIGDVLAINQPMHTGTAEALYRALGGFLGK